MSVSRVLKSSDELKNSTGHKNVDILKYKGKVVTQFSLVKR